MAATRLEYRKDTLARSPNTMGDAVGFPLSSSRSSALASQGTDQIFSSLFSAFARLPAASPVTSASWPASKGAQSFATEFAGSILQMRPGEPGETREYCLITGASNATTGLVELRSRSGIQSVNQEFCRRESTSGYPSWRRCQMAVLLGSQRLRG